MKPSFQFKPKARNSNLNLEQTNKNAPVNYDQIITSIFNKKEKSLSSKEIESKSRTHNSQVTKIQMKPSVDSKESINRDVLTKESSKFLEEIRISLNTNDNLTEEKEHQMNKSDKFLVSTNECLKISDMNINHLTIQTKDEEEGKESVDDSSLLNEIMTMQKEKYSTITEEIINKLGKASYNYSHSKSQHPSNNKILEGNTNNKRPISNVSVTNFTTVINNPPQTKNKTKTFTSNDNENLVKNFQNFKTSKLSNTINTNPSKPYSNNKKSGLQLQNANPTSDIKNNNNKENSLIRKFSTKKELSIVKDFLNPNTNLTLSTTLKHSKHSININSSNNKLKDSLKSLNIVNNNKIHKKEIKLEFEENYNQRSNINKQVHPSLSNSETVHQLTKSNSMVKKFSKVNSKLSSNSNTHNCRDKHKTESIIENKDQSFKLEKKLSASINEKPDSNLNRLKKSNKTRNSHSSNNDSNNVSKNNSVVIIRIEEFKKENPMEKKSVTTKYIYSNNTDKKNYSNLAKKMNQPLMKGAEIKNNLVKSKEIIEKLFNKNESIDDLSNLITDLTKKQQGQVEPKVELSLDRSQSLRNFNDKFIHLKCHSGNSGSKRKSIIKHPYLVPTVKTNLYEESEKDTDNSKIWTMKSDSSLANINSSVSSNKISDKGDRSRHNKLNEAREKRILERKRSETLDVDNSDKFNTEVLTYDKLNEKLNYVCYNLKNIRTMSDNEGSKSQSNLLFNFEKADLTQSNNFRTRDESENPKDKSLSPAPLEGEKILNRIRSKYRLESYQSNA